MRTDRPWLEIARSLRTRPPKPQRVIEEEVAPGRLLFGPGRRQWLAILGVMFGMGGAGATFTVGTHRGATAGALSGPGHAYADPFGWGPTYLVCEWCLEDTDHAPIVAVLSPGRRPEPVL